MPTEYNSTNKENYENGNQHNSSNSDWQRGFEASDKQDYPLTNKHIEITYTLPPELEKETKCGVAGCHPDWFQILASKKTFVLVYGVTGALMVALGAYFNSTISTIEKRFKFSSRTSGLIISALEIGCITLSLVLSYVGGRGHKTRWVAAGIFFIGLSCFMRALPHFLFGAGSDALALTLEYGEFNATFSINKTQEIEDLICRDKLEEYEDCSLGSTSAPSIILFVALYIMGVGISPYSTLGLAYLDDNVRKDKSPFLLSVSVCMKMLGSTFGYMIGAYVLSLYVDITVHPTIGRDDPRWIGAWWLGWTPLGILSMVLGFSMICFPKTLPRAAIRAMEEKKDSKEEPKENVVSMADFKKVMSRLMKNKVLMCNSFSSVIYMLGMIGYWSFMPKYMEAMFRQTASKASFIAGSVTLAFAALGIVTSGSIISKFKPRARSLAAWNIFVEVLDILGFIVNAFLNCSVDDLHGSRLPDDRWNLTASCNSGCDCGTALKYSPVCSTDGSTTFYSACHAGCTTTEIINGTKMYGNCSCIGEDSTGMAVDGLCPVECHSKFLTFLILRCVLTFFMCTGRAGNTMIQFRCVDPEDKAMSIGFTDALMSAVALIPGPVIYGALLDSTCLVWGQTCGERGNCWLYDGRKMGYVINFMAFGCILIATTLDVGVWYYVKDLNIYDKKDEDRKKDKNKKNRKPK